MKNYLAILVGAALAVAASASCSKLNEQPVFDANESFAAFEVESYSVPEREDTSTTVDDTLIIPVSVASYQPVKTNVAYKILDTKLEGSAYTATEGVDFVDLNPDKVLIFDGKARTMEIKIAIKEHRGTYTGDLSFAVQIVSASGLKLSAENTATVTITDNDHPLANILGKYTVTSNCYDGESQPTYTLTLTKDPDDVHTVHIDYLTYGAYLYRSVGDMSYVGTIDDLNDLSVIKIARGQKTAAYFGGGPTDNVEIWTYTSVSDYIYGLSNTGTFEMVSTTPGVYTTDAKIWCKLVVQGFNWAFVAENSVWTKQ